MRDFSAKCCTDPCSAPLEYSCLWSEVIQGYCKLYKRHDEVVTKRKNIWKLAQPKHKKLKYQTECKCARNTKCQIEIVDKTDRMKSTRTEQLAYPKLRQLTNLKNHPSYSSFNNIRKSVVNRQIRKGLFSVYSRLQNITPEEEPPAPKVWSRESKAKLMNRIQQLASPKKQPKETRKEPNSKCGGGDKPKLKRIGKLSKPKVYNEMPPNEWVLTDALKDYKATERLIKMSQPKRPGDMYREPDSIPPLTQNALNYIASARIRALATPASRRANQLSTKEDNPFIPNVRALKAVASKRVTELAIPKEYTDEHIRDDPYKISRRALTAKITPRLKKLAEPKKR